MLAILEVLAIVWLVLVLSPVLFSGLILADKRGYRPSPPPTPEEDRALTETARARWLARAIEEVRDARTKNTEAR
jgi:hypothetical protein